MASPRLQQLGVSVKALRKALLPARFDPTGTYVRANAVRTRTISFRILAHAELEGYFEDRVIDIAKAALASWRKDRRVTAVTLNLMGFSGVVMTAPPSTLQPPGLNEKKKWPGLLAVDERLEESISNFIRDVSQKNHGVKEANVMSMLLPVGFPAARCDQLLLTSLNQFGADRGLVAHKSGTSYVTQAIDPKDELAKINDLIEGIEPVDDELTALLAVATGP